MAADGHLGMTALSRVTLASAGLSCFHCPGAEFIRTNENGTTRRYLSSASRRQRLINCHLHNDVSRAGDSRHPNIELSAQPKHVAVLAYKEAVVGVYNTTDPRSVLTEWPA